MSLTVGLIVEDVRFADFLVPVVRAIARAAGRDIHIGSLEKTRGCRPGTLRALCDQERARHDLLIVAADSSGPGHADRALSQRQKERGLRSLLGPEADAVLLAIAEPSVEAWLLAEPRSFADAIQHATGTEFRMPDGWSAPRTESAAKELLGRFVREGTGGTLPRGGFEYAEEIVARMHLTGSANASLREFSRALRRAFVGD